MDKRENTRHENHKVIEIEQYRNSHQRERMVVAQMERTAIAAKCFCEEDICDGVEDIYGDVEDICSENGYICDKKERGYLYGIMSFCGYIATLCLCVIWHLPLTMQTQLFLLLAWLAIDFLFYGFHHMLHPHSRHLHSNRQDKRWHSDRSSYRCG